MGTLGDTEPWVLLAWEHVDLLGFQTAPSGYLPCSPVSGRGIRPAELSLAILPLLLWLLDKEGNLPLYFSFGIYFYALIYSFLF